MKTAKIISLLLVPLILTALLPVTAKAAKNGYYVYTISNGEATITDVDVSISGDVTVPSTLGGYPVTAIGESAFLSCISVTSIKLPDSVKSIGKGAFQSCFNLKSVNVPQNVKAIGSYAFDWCNSLTDVRLCEGIEIIGNHAFFGCQSLQSITIPDSVRSIESEAFSVCIALEELKLGSGLENIGYKAFEDCSSLENIKLPESVTYIGNEAFYHTAYYNNSENWENGLLYLGNHLISVDKKISGAHEIKDGTLTVPFEAFHDCKGLTDITLPASLIRTEYEQFKGCTNLIGVTLKDGFDYIDSRSFADCKSLNYIIIPDSVTHIGYASFYNTAYYNNYKKWEDGVLYIGNHLIEFDSSASEYEIKKGTLTIASDAFYNNRTIENVIFPDSVKFISLHAFQWCKSLKSVRLSESLECIEYAAFEGCESLESLFIPKSVKYIGEAAFSQCTNLADVYFEDTGAWKAGNSIISPSELTSSEAAAQLLSTKHSFDVWTRSNIGDTDGKTGITANDAIYLLYHVFFGDESYPVNQSCDFDASGSVDANDAIYLLYHVFFGEESYPLY